MIKYFKKIGLLLMAFVFTLSINGQVSVHAKEVGELWNEKDFQVAVLAIDYLKTDEDENGNILMEIVAPEKLDKGLKELDYPLDIDEFQKNIDNYNDIMVNENDESIMNDF
ncbi:hypothetical protein P4S83_15960 [Aneurinibacillus thermoaerophilus]|uniref:hypothetical protein n=1 Tax=Aneurinibacillus thermoaerophilus TaxID=143495 RepID=UPI002E1EA9C3|nr:hypothetical protein [Aneurinibacillus thermoaerophilus]MED0764834.1 hypothetical protein [Aneurinibacillus thermoaerophilus]